jgi:hypothetical protein
MIVNKGGGSRPFEAHSGGWEGLGEDGRGSPLLSAGMEIDIPSSREEIFSFRREEVKIR